MRPLVAPVCLAACLAAAWPGVARARAPNWVRLDGPAFTLFSGATEKETREWAVGFDQFRLGIGQFLNTEGTSHRPVTVVLFRSEDDMRHYLPLEKGKPAHMAGIFLRAPSGNFIEVAADHEDEQTRGIIFHEETHWVTNASSIQRPLWLDEGLAEVFSTFTVGDDFYTFGKALPWHLYTLREHGMIPLKELMKIQRGSLLYNEGERTNIFYAESWLFVHYLLFSDRGKERVKYNELVTDLKPDSDPDAIFLKVFGVDCAEMDKRLEDYRADGTYVETRIKFDRSAVVQAFKVRAATPGEVEIAEASLLAVVGRPSEALPRLARILAAQPSSTLAWESQGLAEVETRDYDRAERSFERAAELGSTNSYVYSYLGDSALGVAPGYGTSRAPGGPRAAVTYYERALALNPLDQHAYDNIAANAWVLEPLTQEEGRILVQGAHVFPDDAQLRVGLAVVVLKQGHVEPALAVLRQIAADARPSDRDAAVFAQNILYDQRRMEVFNHLVDLQQRQDFHGIIAYIDAQSKADFNPADWTYVEKTRTWAEVVLKIQDAVALANDGSVPEAIALLKEADASATDAQTKVRIQELLSKLSAQAPHT
jgi:tetratricopeptide (TPR) repeat protein